MCAGTSYYHRPQGLGRVFAPSALKGYFNDLTAKTNWNGKTDQNGIPLNTLTTGARVYFPVLLCQKALGHWDRWLMQDGVADQQEFLKLACWLKERQDCMGGWDTHGPLGQPPQYRYSAMTQGEAISVLVRAYSTTADAAFERASKSAMNLMMRPIEEGGVCSYEVQDVFLEECPGSPRDTVLNGWIFSLFGVHDYLLLFPDHEARALYANTCASLARHLHTYDAGFWSYYSIRTKRLASPFYHNLHINQLRALAQIMHASAIDSTLSNWRRYENSLFYRFWAIILKGFQKLKETNAIMIAE